MMTCGCIDLCFLWVPVFSECCHQIFLPLTILWLSQLEFSWIPPTPPEVCLCTHTHTHTPPFKTMNIILGTVCKIFNVQEDSSTEVWMATGHRQLLLLLSHVSRVQLCDPIDGSPPGSPIPGILQARTRAGCHFLLQCMKVKSEKWSRSVVSNS